MFIKKRRLLLSLGTLVPLIPIKWREPIVRAVILPVHGEVTVVPRAPEVEAQNATCTQGTPSVVSFDLCNLEAEAVTVLGIDPGSTYQAVHLSPSLPFTISTGECVSCMAEGATEQIFDCSGQFGFGYEFTSESGLLFGISGSVPLEPE